MKTVPVLLNFDTQKPIGFLTIDESALPELIYSTLSVGYKTDGKDYELLSIGVVPDEKLRARDY